MTTHKPWDIISIEWLVAFPEWKTAQQLGLKVWELFVCNIGTKFQKWEVLKLYSDDWSTYPFFTNWKIWYVVYLSNLAPLPKQKTLPQYFAIKQCDHPLWKEYIDWFHKKHNKYWAVAYPIYPYYWFDGHTIIYGKISNFRNTPTVLTLEDWKEMVTEEVNVDDVTDIDVPNIYTHTISRKWATFTKDTINGESSLSIRWQYEELGKLIEEYESLTF